MELAQKQKKTRLAEGNKLQIYMVTCAKDDVAF